MRDPVVMPARPGVQHRNGVPAAGGTITIMVLALRAILGGVLLYAGFLKAAGPIAEFAAAIEAYKLLPSILISPLALALPYVEMGFGVYLFSGFLTRMSAVAAGAMFATYLAVLGSALARGIDLASCGCFGADTLSPRHTIVMDAVLLAISALLYKLSKEPTPYSLDAWLKK